MSTDATMPPETSTAPGAGSSEKTTSERAEQLYETAREKTEEAYDATVSAVKKHPGTAAAIATGAVAAIAGAAFGASKLMQKGDSDKKSGSKKK